jgi:hypothetical protein
VITVTSGDGPAEWLTAIATLSAVVAAVGIALRSDAQVREERRLAREHDQLAEAYSVEIVQVEWRTRARPPGLPRTDAVHVDSGVTSRVLCALITNHSTFTITGIEVQFCVPSPQPSLIGSARSEVLGGLEYMRGGSPLTDGWTFTPPDHKPGALILTRADVGARFWSDAMPDERVVGWYPVVRWTDRWGQRWEHRLGDVRNVDDNAPWEI